MKKIYALLITMILLFAACQPTPESPVVVNKANNELESKIQQTAPPTPQPAPEETPVPLQNVQRTFTAKDKKVEITVDAKVFVPTQNLPVVIIEPDEISLDFIEKAAQVLMEGKTLYEPRTQLTRSEIDEKILELQMAIANPEESKSDGLRSGDPETVAEVTKMFEDRIKIYQGMLETAPEEYTPQEAVLEFKPAKYYESEQRYKENVAEWSNEDNKQAKDLLRQYEDDMQMVLDANLDGGYYGRISVSNYAGDLSRWNTLRFIKSTTLNQNTFGPNFDTRDVMPAGITAEQAKEKMNKLIADLGLDDMVMTYFYQSENQEWDQNGNPVGEKEILGFSGVFQRKYHGVEPLRNTGLYDTTSEKQYRPRYTRESINIAIYEDEIVSFNWENPVKEVEVENENVMTMPFEEIMDIFEQQMSLMYNVEKLSRDAPENDRHEQFIKSIEKGYIKITDIRLGMERIPMENDLTRYRMIPVWRFYGSEYLKIEGMDTDITNMAAREGEMAYLTLNAIDGSIVDYQTSY